MAHDTYLALSKLGFCRRLVLVIGRSERRKCGFVRLADILELLHVAASSCEIDLGDLECGP